MGMIVTHIDDCYAIPSYFGTRHTIGLQIASS